jgi:hypothetical protein
MIMIVALCRIVSNYFKKRGNDLDTIFNQFYWIIPTALMIVAIIQTSHWILLNRAASRPSRREKVSPVMPTSPRVPSSSSNMSGNMSGNFADNTQVGGFQATMTILEGMQGTTEIRLPKSSFGIGRFYNPDDDILIALDERSISRRHAYFSSEANAFLLTDTGSSYGTAIYINDKYVNLSPGQPEQIYNGDVVLFGNTIKVQLRLPGLPRN